jgi:TetR/AcrR family transcriptional repressor of lmrAB and yxaGH operons
MSEGTPARAAKAGTRERLVDATVALLQEKGPSASGTAEILATARAPRGSFYHYFPQGKAGLIVEAVQQAGASTHAGIEAQLRDHSLALPLRVETLLRAEADDQVATDFRFGCAVGATTLETACTPGVINEATRAAFASWTDLLVDVFTAEHIGLDDAVALADTIISAMEGATMLARARHDPAPLHHAGRMASRLVAATLEAR